MGLRFCGKRKFEIKLNYKREVEHTLENVSRFSFWCQTTYRLSFFRPSWCTHTFVKIEQLNRTVSLHWINIYWIFVLQFRNKFLLDVQLILDFKFVHFFVLVWFGWLAYSSVSTSKNKCSDTILHQDDLRTPYKEPEYIYL